jgi:hypothetical protein
VFLRVAVLRFFVGLVPENEGNTESESHIPIAAIASGKLVTQQL